MSYTQNELPPVGHIGCICRDRRDAGDDRVRFKPDRATCGNCGRSWCMRCDPCPSAQCHYCTGRGESFARLDWTCEHCGGELDGDECVECGAPDPTA